MKPKYKKIVKIFCIFVIFIAAIETTTVTLNNSFFKKVSNEEALKRGLDKSTGNAIKHAYAASLLYSALRTIYFSENFAENTVIFLGNSNEVAEIIFRPRRDSTLEMMKDLGNNLIGIEAAKWLEKNEMGRQMGRLNLIGELAEENILFVNQKDVFLDAEIVKKPDFFIAKKWAEENKDKIQKRMAEFQLTLAKHVVRRRDAGWMLQNRASIST
ncbi:MAG: hypothetical protein V4694_04830, partial [Pseudomonadota bacterium]